MKADKKSVWGTTKVAYIRGKGLKKQMSFFFLFVQIKSHIYSLISRSSKDSCLLCKTVSVLHFYNILHVSQIHVEAKHA